jgi:hypothetical protein
MDKKTFSERINERLREPSGEIFKRGKWRFWFPLVVGLTMLNGILTAWIVGGAGLQTYIGIIVATMGALLCWLSVGNLHYSDSEDLALARGVSLLDSITLVFVIAHFCFLLWAQGHLITLRAAEANYGAKAEAFNVKAERISEDNAKIAASAERVASETTKTERLRLRTAYQQRKAAEAGARISTGRAGPQSLAPSLSTAPIELEKPKAPLMESSAAFLARWDGWIRLANFGELILAAVTLIYIRNRSAAFNAKNAPRVSYGVAMGIPAAVAGLRRNSAKKATLVATAGKSELDALREHLKVISSYLPGRWFKADPIAGGVLIRLCERREGREATIKQTRQSNRIFAALGRSDFQERLRAELVACGFPIGGE